MKAWDLLISYHVFSPDHTHGLLDSVVKLLLPHVPLSPDSSFLGFLVSLLLAPSVIPATGGCG